MFQLPKCKNIRKKAVFSVKSKQKGKYAKKKLLVSKTNSVVLQ